MPIQNVITTIWHAATVISIYQCISQALSILALAVVQINISHIKCITHPQLTFKMTPFAIGTQFHSLEYTVSETPQKKDRDHCIFIVLLFLSPHDLNYSIWSKMTPNDLKWLQMSLYLSEKSPEVNLIHLKSFVVMRQQKWLYYKHATLTVLFL